MNIKSIQVSQIQRFDKSPCFVVEDEFITELAASIKESGLLMPIIVKRIDDTHYEIIDGNKRLQACKKLEYASINCSISEGIDEKEQILIALIANLQRHTLTPLEIARSIEHLINLEMSHKDIAKRIGKSSAWVQVRYSILSLEPEVLKLMGPETPVDKRISQSQAYLLVDIPKQDQIDLATILSEEQLSTADTRRTIASTVKIRNIKLTGRNTSRLCLIEDAKKFTQFIERTDAYTNNFLGIKAKEFKTLFDRKSPDQILELQKVTAEISKSMLELSECLKTVYHQRDDCKKTLAEIKTKVAGLPENEKDGNLDKLIGADDINIRSASIMQLLSYVGMGRCDLYGKRTKGGKNSTFWKRNIDHLEVLRKAKDKYMQRIKNIHPDVSNNAPESAAILNSTWNTIKDRFQLHGITLNGD